MSHYVYIIKPTFDLYIHTEINFYLSSIFLLLIVI